MVFHWFYVPKREGQGLFRLWGGKASLWLERGVDSGEGNVSGEGGHNVQRGAGPPPFLD